MVFFHRFFTKHSFTDHDRFEVAVACLLLAAKTEEAPKKLAVVIVECHKVKMSGSKNSPEGRKLLDTKSDEYNELRDRILLLERLILHTIAFELSVDHPYKDMVDQVQKLMRQRQLEYETPKAKVQSNMTNELVQFAMNYANDSMHTTLCLQFPARPVAMSCIYMAGKSCGMRPTEGRTWLQVLEISPETLTCE